MFKKDISIEKNQSLKLCGIKIRHKEATDLGMKKINRKIISPQLF